MRCQVKSKQINAIIDPSHYPLPLEGGGPKMPFGARGGGEIRLIPHVQRIKPKTNRSRRPSYPSVILRVTKDLFSDIRIDMP